MRLRWGLSRIPRMGEFGGNEAWLIVGRFFLVAKRHPRPQFLINIEHVGHITTGGWCE